MTKQKFSGFMPHAALMVSSLLWASSFIALKLAFTSYHPMVVIAGRMMVGSLCFIFVPWVFRGVKILRQDIRPLFLMVLMEPCLYFVFEAKALVLTTASQAGMITALCPLMVSFGAFFVLGERLTLKTIAGMVISVVGRLLAEHGRPGFCCQPQSGPGQFLRIPGHGVRRRLWHRVKTADQPGVQPLFPHGPPGLCRQHLLRPGPVFSCNGTACKR